MLKTLLATSILSTGLISSPIVANIETLNLKNYASDLNTTYETTIIDTLESENENDNYLGQNDLHIQGAGYETLYRIYVDTSGDRNMPGSNWPTNDYLITSGVKKDHWYEHRIRGLSIDVTKYANNKSDFLEKFPTVTLSYFYMINFWNAKMKWTFQHGKYAFLQAGAQTLKLEPNNHDDQIFESTDTNHSSNEKTRLIFKQKWEGNKLEIETWLGVLVKWKAGSKIKHASTASFTKDYYTFTYTPKRNQGKQIFYGKLDHLSKFEMPSAYQQIDLGEIDEKVKIKAKEEEIKSAWFKSFPIVVQGYYGSKKIDNIEHIYSILVRWNPKGGLFSKDSTLLFNGLDVKRYLSVRFYNNKLSWEYKNSFGEKQELNISSPDFDNNIVGIGMEGVIHLPFIYIK